MVFFFFKRVTTDFNDFWLIHQFCWKFHSASLSDTVLIVRHQVCSYFEVLLVGSCNKVNIWFFGFIRIPSIKKIPNKPLYGKHIAYTV